MMTQNPSVVLDIKEIIRILPHRYPILLVDRIVHLDLEGNVIIGQKNVTVNEQFFQGHFPGVPLMPGHSYFSLLEHQPVVENIVNTQRDRHINQ